MAAETTQNDFKKMTDENMDEYTKFSSALNNYVWFLLKKRGISYVDVIQILVPTVRTAVIMMDSAKE
jgi:hypothetical protein